ncbi:hypothetical protein CL630_03160 [bacterium]|nr:hypothetical protein [bacterium]
MRCLFVVLFLFLIYGCAAPANTGFSIDCYERKRVIAFLKKEHSEALKSVGLSNKGNLVEVFISSGGSFTIMLTTPKGMSCPIEEGKGWRDIQREKPGDRI